MTVLLRVEISGAYVYTKWEGQRLGQGMVGNCVTVGVTLCVCALRYSIALCATGGTRTLQLLYETHHTGFRRTSSLHASGLVSSFSAG